MPDPIQIERTFNNLKRELSQNPSTRAKLWAINSFMDILEDDYTPYESYLLQLVEWLPSLKDPLVFTGMDPANYYRLYQKMKAMGEQVPALLELKKYQNFLADLQQLVALQYAFMGEPLEALRVLDGRLNKSLESRLEQWLRRTQDPPFYILQNCIEKIRKDYPQYSSALERLKNKWETYLDPSGFQNLEDSHGFSVLIPTVVQKLDSGKQSEGCLRRLTAELFELSKNGSDWITTNFEIEESDESKQYFIKRVTESVRYLLRYYNSKWVDRGIRARLSYTHSGWFNQGYSMQLAAAGLLYSSICSKKSRRHYTLKPGVAVTGLIDGEANVQPVDEAGLKAKVKAAFFSWAEVLVVPDVQRKTVVRYLGQLKEKYPNRKLEVFGVNRLRDLFYDRRVSRYHRDNIVQYYGKQLWRHKFKAAGVLLLLILSLMTVRQYFGPLDRNPVSAKLVDNEFLIENDEGQIIDRLPAGHEMSNQIQDSVYVGKHDVVLFKDATGDGNNEVFWFQIRGRDKKHYTWLHAKDVANEKKLWSRPLEYTFKFIHKRDPISELYMGVSINFLDSKSGEDKSWLIVNSRHNTYFPAVLERVNALNGKQMERYLNPGYIRSVHLLDLDGNGREEIIATGESNAWNEPIIAVLDPFSLSGHAPLNKAYQVSKVPKAQEIAYWRFPETVVERKSDLIMGQSLANNLNRIKVANQFMVDIHVRYKNPVNGSIGKAPFIKCYFNYQFKMIDVGTHNYYDRLAQRLKRSKKIKKPLNLYRQYFNQYADSLKYWNGTTWQHAPTMNLEYLQARASINHPSYEYTVRQYKSKKTASKK